MINSLELEKKIQAVRKIYRARNKKGILLENQNNMSWLFKCRTYVNIATIHGVVDVLINDEGIYLLANNIEAKRMAREEFEGPVSVREYPWYEQEARNAVIHELTEGIFISDSECGNELQALRLIMSPEEMEQYAALGKDTAEGIQEACMCIRPGMSEFKAAGIMAEKLMEREIEPIILLVAADERIMEYRHPLPTSKGIEDYVMLVAGGRRRGQIACITRFVKFSEIPDELKRKRDAVLHLDAMLEAETRPGVMLDVLFSRLVEGYGECGYPEEWKLHHQGGVTGYNSREIKVSFDTSIQVEVGQVYAWNPSITGFKAEDTMMIEDKANLVLTQTRELPSIKIQYRGSRIEKPDILVRKQFK